MKINPFNPNSVVTPNLFAGRTTQTLDVCNKLSQIKLKMPASFFVYGERGIGKTALAKLIKYVAEGNDELFDNINLLTSYYMVEKGQDIGSVLEASINALTEKMDKTIIDKLTNKLGNLFKNGKFSIGSFSYESNTNIIEKNITIKDQSVSILSNIIEAITAEKFEDKENQNLKNGVLIIIDEMDNLKDIKDAASVLRNIITTLDVNNLGCISFLLVGYNENRENFFDGDPSACRTFDLVKLDTMPNNEAIEVLEKGFTKANVKFDPIELKKGIEVAGGYPHSIQILGRFLIEVDADQDIQKDDWESAIFKASFELRTKEFSRMFSFNKKLNLKDKILELLAEENKPITKKEIRGHLGENSNIYQYIPNLIKTGAIKEDEEGKIFLQSQLFRTAILMDKIIRSYPKKKQEEENNETVPQ